MIRTDIGRTDKNGNAAWLAPAAAASLRRVDAALGFILAIVWAGRTRAEQLVLWLKYGKDPTKAAAPGTSLHEEGMSIDVPLRFVTAKFVALMLARGWKQTVKGEPWHFTYSTARDKHLNDPAPASAGGSTAPTPKEDDMRYLVEYKSADDRNGIVGVIPGQLWHKFTTEEFENKLVMSVWAGAPTLKPGNAREYDILKASLTQGVVK